MTLTSWTGPLLIAFSYLAVSPSLDAQTVGTIGCAVPKRPVHIYYSQEFRSYSLLCLLGTISMYYFYKKRYDSIS